MSRKYRLVLMLLSIITLLALGIMMYGNFSFISELWCASGLLMIILLSLVDQPFFSKDSNIFVNAITAGLALLLVAKSDRNVYFWVVSFITIYLLISSYVLMWLRKSKLDEEPYVIQCLSRLNRLIGKPSCLFSLFFLWGIISKFSSSKKQFFELCAFWALFLILNTKLTYKLIIKILPIFDNTKDDEENIVGENFGVQSENIFLAKVYKNTIKEIRRFDQVDFVYGIDKKLHIGIILDIYYLNQERWIKIYSLEEKEECNKKYDVVYKSDTNYLDKTQKSLVGIVAEGSAINKVKFEYFPLNKIEVGQLLQLKINNERIIYQVTEGVTESDVLEEKNESSKTIGEAMQLGKWDEENKRFIRYGWVPTINTPIYLIDNLEKIEVDDSNYIIGNLPDTNFPVVLNKEIAITHHTAILGITGSGKSVFARNLINQIANKNSKVIVIDITGEYIEKDKTLEAIVSDEDAKVVYNAINTLNKEMSEFKNNRKQSVIENNKEIIIDRIGDAIEKFVMSDRTKTIFTLPNIVNEVSAIDYTKWFLLTLFNYVKTSNNNKKICVVLEEAHTIVPEWNSMGVDDNSSKASINSIAQIALQGRKYNIGFIVIAQRTANVSKTVLTQCNSIIVFQELDNTTLDFLSNYMGKQYVLVVPTLKSRQAIAVGKAFKSNTPMIFEVPEINEE